MKSLSNPRFFCAAALALVPLFPCAAQAQPNVDNGAKADNPTNRAARPDRANRAPDQRVGERLRRQLEQGGVTDAATQDKLLTYVAGEVKARAALLEKAHQLQTGLRGGVLSDTQAAALLNAYQGAIEEDKTRRSKAEDELKKALDFSKMPKVEALLTLLGLYGDGPALMGANGGNGRGGKQKGNAAQPDQTRPNPPEAAAGAQA